MLNIQKLLHFNTMRTCASVQAPKAAEVFPIMWTVLEMTKKKYKVLQLHLFLCLMLLNAEEKLWYFTILFY